MTLPVLAINNLSFSYNSSPVLTDISLTVQTGDYVGLVGPNGSGKSTLIRTILGLTPLHDSAVSLFGEPLAAFRDWHKIGYLPQRIGQINPHFPACAEEIVALGLLSLKNKYPKRVSAADRSRINDAMELLGIADLRKKPVGELSGGQQQRVYIARAIVNRPSLLILDEPTTALDPETRERFYTILSSLNQSEGMSVIFVTHDIGTIGRYANQLLYLDKKIIFYGGFDAFCRSSEMAAYFGDYSQHIICHRHDHDAQGSSLHGLR